MIKKLLTTGLFISLLAGDNFLVVMHTNLYSDEWFQPFSVLKGDMGYQVDHIEIIDGMSVSEIADAIATHVPPPEVVLLVGDALNYPDSEKEIVNAGNGNYMPFGYEEMNVFLGWSGFETRDIASDKVLKDELKKTMGIKPLIGRVPAESVQDMVTWVNKLVEYYSFSQYREYRDKILLVTDNKDHPTNGGSEWGATRDRDIIINDYLAGTNYELVLLNSGDYPGGYYENIEVRAADFEEAVNALVPLVYTHGSAASENWLNNFYWYPFDSSGNQPNWAFHNSGKYPFLWGYSCSIGRIQRADELHGYREVPSVMEGLLFLDNAGIIGAVAPTDITFSYTLDILYAALWDRFVNGQYHDFYSLTEDALQDMLAFFADNTTYGTREWEYRTYVFYGDPTIPIATNQFISTNIDTNTTWQGSIVVEQSLTLTSGTTLTIQPGTGVFFKENAGLYIEPGATLNAYGTEAFPIAFAPAVEGDYPMGYWKGITVEGGTVNLDYCKVSGAVNGLYAEGGRGTISHSTFQDNLTGMGINYGDDFTISADTLKNNDTGLILSFSSPVVSGNVIIKNKYYGLQAYRSYSKLTGNEFSENEVFGMELANRSDPSLATTLEEGEAPAVNNTFRDNLNASIWIEEECYPDLGRYLSSQGFVNGGFNDFIHAIGNTDIINNSRDIYAQVNWWTGEPLIAGEEVFTEPTAEELFGPPMKILFTATDSIPLELAAAYELELQGDYLNAATAFETVITTAAQDSLALEALAGVVRCYRALGDNTGLQQKLDSFYSAFQSYPVGLAAYDYSVTAYTRDGDYTEALNRSSLLESAYGGTARLAAVLFERGVIYKLMSIATDSTLGKRIAPGELQRRAQATFDRVIAEYPNTASAELAAWLSGRRHRAAFEQPAPPLPVAYVLHSNYPNPFNPITTITFELPERSLVTLVIYDLLGREVVRLAGGRFNGGIHKTIWNGENQQGKPVSSGMYLYRLSARSMESRQAFSASGKMVLLR